MPEGFRDPTLERLREDFAAAAAPFLGARVDHPIVRRDESGAVEVTLAEGPPTIRVLDGWADRCAPDALGALILATIDQAATERLQAWTTAVQTRIDEPPSRPDRPDPDAPGYSGAPGDLGGFADRSDPGAIFAERAERDRNPLPALLSLLETLDQQLDAAFDALSTGAAGTWTGQAHGTDAAVKIDATENIVAIDLNPRWLAQADGREVTQAVNRALAAALAARRVEGPAGQFVGTPLERMGETLSSPDATRTWLRENSRRAD